MVSLTSLPLLASALVSVPAVCICYTLFPYTTLFRSNITLAASFGPSFVTVMVYVIGAPALMVLGADLTTCRLEGRKLTISVVVDVLLLLLGSTLLVAVAVLLICVPPVKLALTIAVTV